MDDEPEPVLQHPRIAALDREGTRNKRSKRSMSLTLAAVTVQATGTPSLSVAIWSLLPGLPRWVGLGPVRSPPRLARTEQVLRTRSGGRAAC